jgi:DNA uptake protein ComE-like DNA-binding protein
MTISENQFKGLIALGLILAVIPFIFWITHRADKNKIPVYADQCSNCQAVEIIENGQGAGIYFVPPGTTVNGLVQAAGFRQKSEKDVPLAAGMRLVVNSASTGGNIAVTEMPNDVRFSVGLPMDINKAGEEDLTLVKGIGPATAQKIIALRTELNGFTDIKQLMQINGIKEKRIAEIQKYLYVGKR